MPLDLKVHHYERVPGHPNMAKQIDVKPYWRFVHQVEQRDDDGKTIYVNGEKQYDHCTPIICQGGRFYSDGGDEIPWKEIPEEFWAAARKIPESRRAVYKLRLPEERKPVGRPKKQEIVPEASEEG